MLNALKDANREYNAAKDIVEKHYGTNNKMFSELVELIQKINTH